MLTPDFVFSNVTYKKHDDPKAIHAAGATSVQSWLDVGDLSAYITFLHRSGAGVVNLTTAAKKNE